MVGSGVGAGLGAGGLKSTSEKKADELVEAAKKTAAKFSPFSNDKYEQASELYEKAGNQYKLAQKSE